MSQLLASANTIKKLGLTGLGGIDTLEYQLYLFQQLEPKIVHFNPYNGVDDGAYYVEGDVASFLSEYTYLWVNGRELVDGNIFSFASLSYDSGKNWTKVSLSSTSGSYRPNYKDVGKNICGRFDANDYLKDINPINQQVAEDGSIANSVANSMSFEFSDEGKVFYDRNNKTGFFYKKDVLTEVRSIQDLTDYSPVSGVHSTWVKVKYIPKYWQGSDFINGHIEVITGKASGSKSVISDSNGFHFKTLGYFSENIVDEEYHNVLKSDDKVRVYRSDTFWCKLEYWLRGEEDEKVVFCGKVDLDNIRVNDQERVVGFDSYGTVKDLQNKNISDLEFDGGSNLNRLVEFKPMFINSVARKSLKTIVRKEQTDNPLKSIKVSQVSFDVSEGWHVLQFYPSGNLFKFDCGKWFSIFDEGSFEKSTNQVFIPSYEGNDFTKKAKLPRHDGQWKGNIQAYTGTPPGSPSADQVWLVGVLATGAWVGHEEEYATWTGSTWYFQKPTLGDRVYDSGGTTNLMYDGGTWIADLNQVNNIMMERYWHGKWISITIDTEDNTFRGSKQGMFLGEQNPVFKKLSGLPEYPFNLLFYVDDNREIRFQNLFEYSYDNGGFTIPHYLFDFVQEWDINSDVHFKDVTYEANFGCKLDRDDDTYENERPVMGYDGSNVPELSLRCYSNRPFNGIMIRMDNSGFDCDGNDEEPTTYESAAMGFLNHMQVRFSTGYSFEGGLTFKYSGGQVRTGSVVDNGNFTLDIQQISDSWDYNYSKMAGMWLIGLNGDNFLVPRKIQSVTQDSSFLSRAIIQLEEDMPNTVSADDLFTIVNKNFNLKVYDSGDGFKDSSVPDVVSNYRKDIGFFYDLIADYPLDNSNMSSLLRPEDEIYIGYRKKFDSFYFMLDGVMTTFTDDFTDVSWYLREGTFSIEYWDGTYWQKARDVSYVPTTLSPIKDISGIDYNDDYVKYKFKFKADNWHTGGYDHTAAGAYAKPSDIDEDEIYLIRVVIHREVTPKLARVGLSDPSESHLCIMWDTIDKWFPNDVDLVDGKVVADTLEIQDTTLHLFGVEVLSIISGYSKSALRQVKPITKFDGSIGDSIFGIVDYNVTDLDLKTTTDLIVANPNVKNHISYVPRNISYHHLIDKILDAGGFDQTKKNLSFNDSYNKVDKPHLSIIGSEYDGSYPISVGWDAALINQDFDDNIVINQGGDTYISTTALKRSSDGKYLIMAVTSDGTEIHGFYADSLDGTWSKFTGVMSNRTTHEVIDICLVRNKNDGRYAWYVVCRENNTSDYVVKYYSPPVNSITFDISSAVTIASSPGNHFGSVSAVQLEGAVNDSSSCARLMWTTIHSGTGVSGFIPSGTPSLQLYSNSDSAPNNPANWSSAGSPIANLKNAKWIRCNYTCSSQPPFHTYNDSVNKGMIIATDTSTNRLVRLINPTQLTGSWNAIDVTTDTWSLTGYDVFNEGNIYNYRDQATKSAYTMNPTTLDVNVVVGISSGTITCASVNRAVNDWSANGWWKSMLQEFNSMDWFKSYNSLLTFNRHASNERKRLRLYLGFRKPFNKIDFESAKVSLETKVLQIRYWTGSSWDTMGNIFQDNKIRTDGKFHINYGITFDPPVDWRADSFENVLEEAESNSVVYDINQNINSLYWVEISLGSYADNSDEVNIKTFKNCYTCLFLTKGRSLFLMENWKYSKLVYTYPYESDKKILIDSIAYDKDLKLVAVNYSEDNPYDYNKAETMVFDVFGDIRSSFPVRLQDTYEGVNQYTVLKDRPESIYRKGYEHTYAVTEPSISAKAMIIGCWDDSFLSYLYLYGTHTPSGESCVGYNIPVPSNQFIRKWTDRTAGDWIAIGGSTFVDNVLNNIWLARREDLIWKPTNNYSFNKSLAEVFHSLTNSGLLHEELMNSPYTKLQPGMYAAMEKNMLVRERYVNWTVQNDVAKASVPAASFLGETYILTDTNEKDYLYWWAGIGWETKAPTAGMKIYHTTDNNYWYYDGKAWRVYSENVVWPGRSDAVDEVEQGIGLEWSLGNNPVKIPYFRPWNSRPERFLNGNAWREFDQKAITVFRHIPFSTDYRSVFGHDLKLDNFIHKKFPYNLKPTCAALMEDLSAIKDSDYGSDALRIMDGAAPGFLFGCYEFKDRSFNYSSVPDRYDSGDDSIAPFANSAICMYKPYSRIKEWNQAWYYDGSLATYSDITTSLNHRNSSSGAHNISPAGDYIYVSSSSKFFAIALNKSDDYPKNISIEYWDRSSVWQSVDFLEIDRISEDMGTFIENDEWARKTTGYMYTWNPFNDDWVKTTVNGVEGYYVRISYPLGGFNSHDVNWVTLAGQVVWDSLRWWDDYSVIANNIDTTPDTQDEYRLFDTYVPISIEYDLVRNRVTGCFWNYLVGENKYYPFVIQFDRDRIKGGEYDLWSWEMERFEILDEDGVDYSYKIQSIKNISPIENKAILIKDAKPDDIGYMAVIKNYHTGDIVFNQDI